MAMKMNQLRNPSKFIKHTSCPNCGSSDANAVYEDGSTFCFSCSKSGGTRSIGAIHRASNVVQKQHFDIPPDLSFEFSQECLDWCAKYHVTAELLIKNGIKWSNKNKQLVFIYENVFEGDIGCLQARNFRYGPKYINQGESSLVMPIYKADHMEADTIVLVEDTMSAIRVADSWFADAMPLLGSHMSYEKQLKLLTKNYKNVILWLDHDKYEVSLSLQQRFQMLGITAHIIKTDLDPKCYTDGEIIDKINGTV